MKKNHYITYQYNYGNDDYFYETSLFTKPKHFFKCFVSSFNYCFDCMDEINQTIKLFNYIKLMKQYINYIVWFNDEIVLLYMNNGMIIEINYFTYEIKQKTENKHYININEWEKLIINV